MFQSKSDYEILKKYGMLIYICHRQFPFIMVLLKYYRQVPGAKTFIDAAKFAGPQQLEEYIKEVNTNEQLYLSFFNFNLAHLKSFERRYHSEYHYLVECARSIK